MANGIQCPNCGGFRTTLLEHITVIEETPAAGCVGRTLVLFFIIAFLGFPLLFEDARDAFFGIFTGKIRNRRIIGANYVCSLCGYRWKWLKDEPSPEVHIRPDLIAKGERRLQEEEATRRWRDQGYYEYYIKPKQK